jgi:hypothetical protein
MDEKFIGELKVRNTFFVKVMGIRNTQFNTYAISFTMRDGKRGHFFLLDPTGDGIVLGDCITITATPTEHNINTFDASDRFADTRMGRAVIKNNTGSIINPKNPLKELQYEKDTKTV